MRREAEHDPAHQVALVPEAVAPAAIMAGADGGAAAREESAARLKRRRACLELGQRKEDFLTARLVPIQ